MSEQTSVSFTVPWVAFRRALCAVLPCADHKGTTPDACRVQIQARTAGRILISATDRFVLGCVAVETLVPPQEDHRVDLSIAAARKVLSVFPEMPEDADYTLHVLVTDEQVEIRDVSGMIDGEHLAVTRIPESEDVFSVPRALARKLAARDLPGDITHAAFALDRFKKFSAATKCYAAHAPVLTWSAALPYYIAEDGPQILDSEAGIAIVSIPVLCTSYTEITAQPPSEPAAPGARRTLWRALCTLGRTLRAATHKARGALDRFARGPVAPLLLVDAIFAKEGRDERRR